VSGLRAFSRAAWWAAVLTLCVAAGACARRVPVAPSALAYPDFVFPSDRNDAAAEPLQRTWTLLQGNDLRAATRELDAISSRAPESVAVRTVQGYLALAQRRPDAALRAFDASLASRRAFAPALAGRGYALVDLKRESDALEALQAALAADESLTEVRRRLDGLRLRAVDAAVESGRTARAAGRLDEAHERYSRAIQLSPDSAFLYRDRAAVERDRGRRDAAVADLRRAVALDPSDPEGLTALGGVLAAAGNLQEADRVYRQAYALDPSETIRADITRVAQQLREASLPGQVREIEARSQVSRGDLAALLGVRFDRLLRAAPAAQLVITDLRDDWSRTWITTVAGTGVMEPYANHTFQPAAPALRADLAAASWRLLALAAPARPQLRPYLQDQPRIADVASTHPLYTAAASAVASGVLPLVDGARFDAARGLSGAEAAAAIGRLRALIGTE
jgi:tetratricopeptide (TPR) repeat protein